MEPHPPSGLRSYLFAPANHPRRAQKVFAAGADAAVLDLEDAVAVAEKTAARDAAVAALQQPRSCQGYVRINAVDTPWWRADIEACVGPWLDGLVVPKVETARSIEQVVATVAAAESRAGLLPNRIALVAVIETARGVENANEIAAADPRLRRLAFGGGDYTHDLDLVWSPEETELAYARARLAHASRLAQLEPPIDTVVLEVRDLERFRRSAQHGRAHGFLAKLCIHPDQVPICHDVFTPSADEIARAEAIVRVFQEAEARGLASIEWRGLFIDYPVARQAQRVLARAARASAGGAGR